MISRGFAPFNGPTMPRLLHHLDDARRARVPDAEAPLEHRGGGLPVVHDQPDGLLEELVVDVVRVVRPPLSPAPAHERYRERRLLLLLQEVDDRIGLMFTEVRTLNANRLRRVHRHKEHVAFAMSRSAPTISIIVRESILGRDGKKRFWSLCLP